VDLEVRRLMAQCYDSAVERLRRNRERLDALAAELLAHETLDEAAAYRAAGFPPVLGDGEGLAGDREVDQAEAGADLGQSRPIA
jgi:cell division protease FtsH